MNRGEALRLLQSKTLHERLRGARYLAVHALKDDEAAIRHQLLIEDVSWVRGALKAALNSLSVGADLLEGKARVEDAGEARQADDIYALAIEETTAALVHELEPILGLLRLYASTEILTYQDSRTKRQLDRLDSFLRAID